MQIWSGLPTWQRRQDNSKGRCKLSRRKRHLRLRRASESVFKVGLKSNSNGGEINRRVLTVNFRGVRILRGARSSRKRAFASQGSLPLKSFCLEKKVCVREVSVKVGVYITGARPRMRVLSNFGDGDCGAGDIHTRARAKFRSPRVASPRNFAPLESRLLKISRARACVFRPPHNRHRQN